MCSTASLKTWTPLPDHFIDEYVVEMFPLFDQACLQLLNIMHPAAMLPPRLVVYRVQVKTVGWPQSWSSKIWCFTN